MFSTPDFLLLYRALPLLDRVASIIVAIIGTVLIQTMQGELSSSKCHIVSILLIVLSLCCVPLDSLVLFELQLVLHFVLYNRVRLTASA